MENYKDTLDLKYYENNILKSIIEELTHLKEQYVAQISDVYTQLTEVSEQFIRIEKSVNELTEKLNKILKS